MKRCPVCNRELPDTKKFCDRDGAALVEIAPPLLPRLIIRAPEGGERDLAILSALSTIGKTPDNAIVVSDGAISRKHVQIEQRDGHYLLKDLGSLNGTYLNGKRIDSQEHPLKDGDEIMIGRTRMLFRLLPDLSQFSTVENDALKGKEPAPRRTSVIDAPRETPKAPAPVPAAPPRSAAPLPPLPQPPSPPQAPPKPVPPSPPPRVTNPAIPAGDQPRYRVAQTGELVAPSAAPTMTGDSGPIILDGRYELEKRISQDATGTLYRARRVLLNDRVAIRVLRPELVGDKVAVERFRRQAQVAALIRHPNSVQVFDFGYSPEGAAYIVEELVAGRTLRDLIRKERGLSLAHVVGLFNQICGAVHTAHLNGIVLRDLRPEMIYVETSPGGDELVKVGGYALAKMEGAAGKGQALTGALGVYGLPQYASPEQLLNRPLDARSDIYSLGVILYELLTGTVPFDSENEAEMVAMHMYSPIPDLTDVGRTDLDEGVAAVVARALDKSPDGRQASAKQLAEELEAVSGVGGNPLSQMVSKVTGLLSFPKLPNLVIPPKIQAPAGELALPSVLPEVREKGAGAFNPVVMALMAEAFLSRLSSGMIKTAVPLYALLVFGMKITSVMALVLVQNVVPLLMRPLFGSMADKYGKKKVFMISLTIRTLVGVLYAVASLPVLYFVSVVRGIADSAKGPSASAMIADNTDEKNIAQAYSWYTTTKSTSGGIGEAVAAFVLTVLIAMYAGTKTVEVNFAVTDKVTRSGGNAEEIVRDPAQIRVGEPIPGGVSDPAAHKVLRVEKRTMRLGDVPIDDLPKVIDATPLRKALMTIFLVATVLSFGSLILVAFFIKEKKKEKKEKKDKEKGAMTGRLDAPQEQPNVWLFALLGTALTAPAYMVTGEFFTILAVKLEVTPSSLGWIKILAETIVPLLFGPFFGWLADRIGAGRVIALRSIANLLTSALFWIVPWFAGTALLGLMMGLARAIDEVGKAAFKPTWGAIAAKVSSFNLSARSRTMGILEGGVDASDLAFPVIAGALLQYLSLGPLMLVRALLAIVAEIYGFLLMRKYKI
ncbi:MAG: MFS transporter [Blastocatellia bacterium]|nr:MFS transporter [Blastocatellia bacterium]